MSFGLVFVVSASSMRRSTDLHVLLDALRESWEEVAPRHRGRVPRWDAVVSLPPGHQELCDLLEVTASDVAALTKWVCIIMPNAALCLLGPGKSLSPVGLSYMRAVLARVEKQYPYAKIGLWLALLRGSKRVPEMRVEQSKVAGLEQLRIPMNVLVLLEEHLLVATPRLRSSAVGMELTTKPPPTGQERAVPKMCR